MFGGRMEEEVVVITSKGQMTIPKRLRQKFGLREGSKVLAVETDVGVLIKPLPSLKDSMGIDSQVLLNTDIHKEIRQLRSKATVID